MMRSLLIGCLFLSVVACKHPGSTKLKSEVKEQSTQQSLKVSAAALDRVRFALEHPLTSSEVDTAIRGGVHVLESTASASTSGNVPYFKAWALSQAQSAALGDPAKRQNEEQASLLIERRMISNVSGRALYALALAKEAGLGGTNQAVFDTYKAIILRSVMTYDGSRLVGLASDPSTDDPKKLRKPDMTYLFNMGAGARGMLGAAINSSRIGDENNPDWQRLLNAIQNLQRFYIDGAGQTAGFNWEKFRKEFGLRGGSDWNIDLSSPGATNWSGLYPNWIDPFMVYAYVKALERYPHQEVLSTVKALVERTLKARFPLELDKVPIASFGHMFGPSAELNTLSRLGYLTNNQDWLKRAQARLDAFRQHSVISRTGWVPETLHGDGGKPKGSDVGEVNNTGEVIEAALNLGLAGETRNFEAAEEFTRAHLLPSQLTNIVGLNDDGTAARDEFRRVGYRLQGAWGFPAPYASYATKNPYFTGGYFLDITCGAVVSLLELRKQIYYFDAATSTHEINLLFDHTLNTFIQFKGPYPNRGKITLKLERPGKVHLFLPSWVDAPARQAIIADLSQSGINAAFSGQVLKIENMPVNKEISLATPMIERTVKEVINSRTLMSAWRGSTVIRMDSMNTERPFSFFDK